MPAVPVVPAIDELKTASRASAWVTKRSCGSSAHCSVAKKRSRHLASKQRGAAFSRGVMRTEYLPVGNRRARCLKFLSSGDGGRGSLVYG
jgi:hypothetical protein